MEDKIIQAEMDLLELKKKKIDIVVSLLEKKELKPLINPNALGPVWLVSGRHQSVGEGASA